VRMSSSSLMASATCLVMAVVSFSLSKLSSFSMDNNKIYELSFRTSKPACLFCFTCLLSFGHLLEHFTCCFTTENGQIGGPAGIKCVRLLHIRNQENDGSIPMLAGISTNRL
jgi:hypothetical protein